MWGCVCVCVELNIKDAYFHVRNDSFFEFMASMAVLSVAVCCASAYISRADGQVGQSFGNDGGSSESWPNPNSSLGLPALKYNFPLQGSAMFALRGISGSGGPKQPCY